MDPGAESARVLGTVASRFARFVVGAATSIVISRALLPEGRGQYAVILGVVTISLSLGHLSLEQAHVFLWNKVNHRTTLIANAFVLGLPLGGVSAIAAGLIVVSLGRDTFPIASYSLLVVGLAAVPLSTIVLYGNHFLILERRTSRVNSVSVTAAIVSLAVFGVLALAGQLSVSAVVWVATLSSLGQLILIVSALDVRVRAIDLRLASRALTLGLRYHLGLAAFILLLKVDILLLNTKVSSFQVGLYSLAVTLAELTFLLTDSVSQVVLPRQIDEELEKAAIFTARVVRTSLLVGAMFIGAILVGSPVVIPTLYGQSFAGAIAPLIALAPGVLALSTIRPVSGFLVKLDQPLILSSANIGATVLNVILNLALIPPFGILGAALASSISYMLLAAFHIGWLIHAGAVTAGQLRPRWQDVTGPLAQGLRRVFRRA